MFNFEKGFCFAVKMEGVDHLAQERSRAQFDVDQMKVVWHGSLHALEVSDRIARLVASDPVIHCDSGQYRFREFDRNVQNFQFNLSV